ncbi:unnamed protein product, partial [Symbiodinium sp. CCMP2456]
MVDTEVLQRHLIIPFSLNVSAKLPDDMPNSWVERPPRGGRGRGRATGRGTGGKGLRNQALKNNNADPSEPKGKLTKDANGEPICWRYNRKGGCSNQQCRFKHVCQRCLSSTHAYYNCPLVKRSAGAGGATMCMLYVHAGLPHRGDLAHWIAKDSRNRPFVVDEFDLSLDDSLGEERWEELLHDLQEGHYNLLFLSPPSSTFGRSSLSSSSGSAPLRDDRWPTGFPWLRGPLKTKADRGTLQVQRALELSRLASQLNIFWLWEHPEHLGAAARGTPASVWTWPETRKFFDEAQAFTVALQQCSFGAPIRRPTRLVGNWPNMGTLGHSGWPRFDRDGNYRGPLPRHCGHSHSGALGSLAYPPALCRALARLAWDAICPLTASTEGHSLRRAVKDTSEN